MRWIRSLFSRRRVFGELSEEVRTHLEEKVEELVEGGMSRGDAEAAARREFGNLGLIEEEGRDVWRWPSVESFFMDVRYGLRTLGKSPGFTLVVVLTIALGIGANTAIFSVVNAVLLRPLPYKDSGRLVQLIEHDEKRGVDFDWVSFPNFRDWAERNKTFESTAAYKFHVLNLTKIDQPEVLFGVKVSASLLPTLGAEPIVGRNFSPEEDQPGRDHEVLLSYDTWRHSFGADPKVTGKTVTLNDELYTVVGVMPASFSFPPAVPITSSLPSKKAQFLLPLGMESNPEQRDWNMLGVIGRLKPNVTITQAHADMESIAKALEQQYPGKNAGISVRVEPLLNQVVGDVRPALLVLLGAIGLVLLVACANVTSLLLARSTTRRREMALRRSLGASRVRLIRQLLTESLLLAIAGGACGLLLARGGILVLAALGPDTLPRGQGIAIDGSVLIYTLGISVVAGMIFGLAPAFGAFRADLNDPLKADGTRSTGTARSSRLRSALVISELAASLALLIGAGLMLKSFERLERVNPGFRTEKVLTVWTVLSEAKYGPGQLAAFYERAWQQMEAVPGVKSVGAIDNLPLSGMHGSGPFTIEGHPTQSSADAPVADRSVVSVNYFRTMGIPLLQGREFTERDRDGAATVLMINEKAARRYWPDENPVGKHLSFTTGRSEPKWIEVVGVVGDVLHDGLELPAKPTIYMPFLQWPSEFMVTVVGTEIEPSSVIAGVRGAIGGVDKDQPLLMARTMSDIYSDSVAQRRFNTVLITTFGALALSLAVVGVYGLMAFIVAQRTHEMGVRIALGATWWDVLKLVLSGGVRLTLLGLGLGLAAAFVLTRFLSKLLFDVPQTDPMTFVGVSLCLGGVALVACWIPAKRAMRVDPMVALRHE